MRYEGVEEWSASEVRQLPVDRPLAQPLQRLGDRRAGAAAEELLGRQRRRMRRGQDAVPPRVDEPPLLLGLVAPEYEHDRVVPGVEGADDGVGEGLPAAVLL